MIVEYTKCDMCQARVSPDDYIRRLEQGWLTIGYYDHDGNGVDSLDICPECAEKVKEVLE